MTQHDKTKEIIVHTSTKGWLEKLAKAYRERQPLLLEDDANVGIDPRVESILQMGLKAKLARREWAAVVVSLGVAGVGTWVLVMAVLDPEPFSKMVATIVSGAVLLGTGGLMAVRILTQIKPPTIRVTKAGSFEITWN